MSCELKIQLIDTHCHLDFPEFDQDRDEVISRAREQGIGYIINIGSSIEGSKKSVELARRFDFIYATVGLHPHEADSFDSRSENALKDLAKKNKVVAIGETGLDYYRNLSSAENQKRLFKFLLGLARDLNLAVVIHNRQAQNDTLAILKEFLPCKAVVHCFSGDEDFLKECLEKGLFVSFTCNITYKKADSLRQLAKITPLDRIFLETDAPFLAPEQFRGRRNEPGYVRLLAENIAAIKGIAFDEVCALTTESARKFFNLK